MTLSLVFSDHYFDQAALTQIAARMKSGYKPQLTAEVKEQLFPAVQSSKRMLGLDAPGPTPAPSAAPARFAPRTGTGMLGLAVGVAAGALAVALAAHWS